MPAWVHDVRHSTGILSAEMQMLLDEHKTVHFRNVSTEMTERTDSTSLLRR